MGHLMAKYIQLEEKQIRALAIQYNLVVDDCSHIEGGAGNTSFLLYTNRGKFVLTVFDISIDRVVTLSKLLLHLEKYKFPTTRIIHRIEGGEIAIIKGKPVLIKPYISGQVVRDLDEAQLNQIGTVMAQLHQIPAPEYVPKEHDYGIETFPRAFGHQIDPEYEYWLKQKYDFLQKSIPSDLPTGLIHGDVFYDNVLFDDGQFKAVIDFEEACQHDFIFDIGMGIVGLCVDGANINLLKAKALLSGYQQIRQLLPREKDVLQTMVIYAATATSSWRFWKYHIDTPMPEKAKLHREMMQLAVNANAILRNDVLNMLH